LEDLRAELREWVDKLENEMEGLIEMDWQGYLTLGRGLQGGEQHVKDAERRIKYAEREITVESLS
jgi:COG (conserved oligomeric Golgi) complex component, COG2